jgi:hypothetical protein
VARIIVSILTAIIFGSTWWDEGSIETEVASLGRVQNIIGLLYAGLSFLGAFRSPLFLNCAGFFVRDVSRHGAAVFKQGRKRVHAHKDQLVMLSCFSEKWAVLWMGHTS